MILLYFVVIVLTLIINYAELPHAIGLIFSHAFSNHAATGGFVGATLAAAIRFGIARGLFSNEAGQGSAPIVAATAKTKNPVRQALVSMTGTFIDTVVICTLTALAILTTDVWTLGTVSPSDLTAQSVHSALGDVGSTLVAICIAFFAFSTLIGWSFYGEKAIEYLFKDKVVKYYRIVFSVVVFIGATASLQLVWDFADLMNGLMAIPNLIGIFMLAKIISSETKRYINE
jgi:AGCS family alanine or glycine:cation symporter